MRDTTHMKPQTPQVLIAFTDMSRRAVDRLRSATFPFSSEALRQDLERIATTTLTADFLQADAQFGVTVQNLTEALIEQLMIANLMLDSAHKGASGIFLQGTLKDNAIAHAEQTLIAVQALAMRAALGTSGPRTFARSMIDPKGDR